MFSMVFYEFHRGAKLKVASSTGRFHARGANIGLDRSSGVHRRVLGQGSLSSVLTRVLGSRLEETRPTLQSHDTAVEAVDLRRPGPSVRGKYTCSLRRHVSRT